VDALKRTKGSICGARTAPEENRVGKFCENF
jgi:hypothetical protein